MRWEVVLRKWRRRPGGTHVYEPFPAFLVAPMEASHLAQVAGWRRALKRHAEEDGSWDWSTVIAEMKTETNGVVETFALLESNRVQAAMALEFGSRRSAVSGLSIVYVGYVAVAPWNRVSIAVHPRFKGAGSAMMVAAEQWSLNRAAGRIGLHSKPGALGFYRGYGFRDLGPDPEESGLHYLELNT